MSSFVDTLIAGYNDVTAPLDYIPPFAATKYGGEYLYNSVFGTPVPIPQASPVNAVETLTAPVIDSAGNTLSSAWDTIGSGVSGAGDFLGGIGSDLSTLASDVGQFPSNVSSDVAGTVQSFNKNLFLAIFGLGAIYLLTHQPQQQMRRHGKPRKA